MKRQLHIIVPVFLSAVIGLVAVDAFAGKKKTGPPSYLTLYNRSDYPMIFAVWEDGMDCSGKMELEDAVDLNLPEPRPIVLVADQLQAVGIGITEMRGKAPVFCEYILSFVPQANQQYVLEYYVRDRSCFGNLYRKNNETFQSVTEGDIEQLSERMAEFGWDQFEPACM